MNSVSDQTKEQQGQQNHWLLSNLLLQGRTESTSSADGSPVRMRESSNSPHPAIELQKASPQQKPVNLLPAVPIQTSRKLSDREQRDCDIIGKEMLNIKCIVLNVIHIMLTNFNFNFLLFFIVCRKTHKIILLYCTEIHPG